MLLLFAWIATIYLVGLRLTTGAEEAFATAGKLARDKTKAIVYLVLVVCALPKILLFVAALIVHKSMKQRRFWVMSALERARSAASLAPPGAEPATIAPATAKDEAAGGAAAGDTPPWAAKLAATRQETDERVNLLWEFESEQFTDRGGALDRLLQHAGIYGFMSSVTLLVCAMILTTAFLGSLHGAEPVGFIRAAQMLAAAVGAATALSFARDYGRIVVRAAQRDISAQMLAWSTKHLLLTNVFAAVAVGLAGTQSTSLSSAALIGATVGILGERATQALTERAAKTLAIPARSETAVPLGELDGFVEEDVLRLGEEGIDSLHALAFYSTPKLYLVTKYSLQRICDWQDQALLFARVGLLTARAFRDQLGVRGAGAAQRIAACTLANAPAPNADASAAAEWQDLRKVLGFATDVQLRCVLERLAGDRDIARLSSHRDALPFDMKSKT